MRLITSFVFLFILCLTFLGTAVSKDCSTKKKDICASGSTWYEGQRIKLRMEEKGSPDYSELLFIFPGQQDLSIEIDRKYNNNATKGKIILVSGRLMLSKDIDMKKGYEIDNIDGPLLVYQLVISLLDQAFTKGPSEVTGVHKVNKEEKERMIRVATPSAIGEYPAPWRIIGHVKRINSEKISYDFEYTYTSGNKPRTFKLIGFWEKPKISPKFDYSMNIEKWQIYSLGPIKITNDNGTILDYSAPKKVLKIKTLRELKEYIKKQEKSSNNSLNQERSENVGRG